MKLKILALILSLVAVPAFALAQTPAPANSGGGPMQMTPAQMQQHMQAFRRFHRQAEQDARVARARMLAALSAEHRLMVAHIVGMLAIAPHPDVRAAAHQLDTILSPAERAAILSAGKAEHAAMRVQMQQMRAQMRTQMQADMGQMHGGMAMRTEMRERREHHRPDAGAILLRSLVPGHAMMPAMMLMMHRAPPAQP